MNACPARCRSGSNTERVLARGLLTRAPVYKSTTELLKNAMGPFRLSLGQLGLAPAQRSSMLAVELVVLSKSGLGKSPGLSKLVPADTKLRFVKSARPLPSWVCHRLRGKLNVLVSAV